MFQLVLIIVMSVGINGVQCCSHSEIPSEPSGHFNEEVELILNCSSNHPIVSAIFHSQGGTDTLIQYTILYTCTHDELTQPIQGTAIEGRITNTSEKVLDRSILCDSLCTFGGCYQYGSFPDFRRLSISPLHSCLVCHTDRSGTCSNNRTCDDGQNPCVPTLDLQTGLVNCSCSDPCPDLTVSSPSLNSQGDAPCTCHCIEFHGNYDCKCHLNDSVQCSNISVCDLHYCRAGESHCQDQDSDSTHRCLCEESGSQICTGIPFEENKETGSSISITVLITVLMTMTFFISCVTVLSLLLASFVSKNVHKKNDSHIIMDPQLSNEIYSVDPVDIFIPKHQCVSRSASFSTLCHPIHFLSPSCQQSSSKLSLKENLSAHHFGNSESQLSDSESYVMCGDCTSRSSSETFGYCQQDQSQSNS